MIALPAMRCLRYRPALHDHGCPVSGGVALRVHLHEGSHCSSIAASTCSRVLALRFAIWLTMRSTQWERFGASRGARVRARP
jgi:hypothetical protein